MTINPDQNSTTIIIPPDDGRTEPKPDSLPVICPKCGVPSYRCACNRTTSGDGLATAVKRSTGFWPAPEFFEIAMQYPRGWTELPRLATRSSRKSRN